ncbi:hypothetical protein ACJMK2_038244, partial [Sinanodonta woodiana]
MTEDTIHTPTARATKKSTIGCRTSADKIAEKIGEWFLNSNAYKNNMLCDISLVDYTVGATPKQELIPISEPFCDNCMLFALVPEMEATKSNKNTWRITEICTSKINGIVRQALNNANLDLKGGSYIKAKIPMLLEDNLPENKQQGQIRSTAQEILKYNTKALHRFNTQYNNQRKIVVPVKVDLANIPLAEIISKLSTALTELELNHVYFADIDITQDFANIFNKTEVINFLREKGFNLQGDRDNVWDYDAPTILNNNNGVGRNCITWITKYDNIKTRCKVYNKQVCQWTSAGTTKSIGNHLLDYVKCPDQRLGETFKSQLAQQH